MIYRILGALLVLSASLAGPVYGQGYSADPAAEAFAENAAYTFATESGNTGLANAIMNGSVNVYPGDLRGTGDIAVSWPGAGPGQPGTIVVHYTPDGGLIGPGAVHEWTHLQNGDERLPSGCDPSPADLTALACHECVAHCATFHALLVRYNETGLKPPCSLKHAIESASQWECFICANGSGTFGPPGPNACPDADSSVPCTQ